MLRMSIVTLWSAALLCGCSAASTSVPAITAPTLQPATSTPAPTSAPTATSAPTTTPAPTSAPTATPAPAAPRVGLQVGHWKVRELPEELKRIRGDSGAYYNGYDEWEINYEVAIRTQALLEAAGVTVDLLPATVPESYDADAFVAIHCDGAAASTANQRRGWKVAPPWRASVASQALSDAIAEGYGRESGLPKDPVGAWPNMRGYFIFADYRYQHSIDPLTPAVVMELGFMTHPADREVLFDAPEQAAQGLAAGILGYLDMPESRDPAARTLPDLPVLRAARDGILLYDTASVDGPTDGTLDRSNEFVTFSQREGWYLITVRNDPEKLWKYGWVRAEDVEIVR